MKSTLVLIASLLLLAGCPQPVPVVTADTSDGDPFVAPVNVPPVNVPVNVPPFIVPNRILSGIYSVCIDVGGVACDCINIQNDRIVEWSIGCGFAQPPFNSFVTTYSDGSVLLEWSDGPVDYIVAMYQVSSTLWIGNTIFIDQFGVSPDFYTEIERL